MKKTNKKGFTLAELLITIAILMILMGISFVAVNRYIKGLKLNEMNWTAKEIFLAAQNQLSKANAEGSLTSITDKGYHPFTAEADKDDYYLVVNSGTVLGGQGAAVWKKILPFGSIDETVRMGGHYVIRYNLSTATVKQVYYSDDKKCLFSETDLNDTKFQTIGEGSYTDSERRDYPINGTTCVVGYYDATDESLTFEKVGIPALKVVNGDRLTAEITNWNTNWRCLLCIRGLTSHKETTLNVNDPQAVVLDDITNNSHFSQQFESLGFIPGEDIEIYATVQHKSALSNVEESNHVIENSLFASKEVDGSKKATVRISSFRHLENLDNRISNVNVNVTAENEDDNYSITTASQVSDLTWSTFHGTNGTKITFISGASTAADAEKSSYIPVNIDYALSYSGNNRYIDGVIANVSGPAGMFGEISAAVTISDLELRNFNISGTGDTGALVGTGANCTIDKVIAYNPKKGTEPAGNDAALEIRSTGGAAGGLTGSVSEKSKVTASAAAVYVKANTSAGGLVGISNGGTVEDSYAGGHTVEGQFSEVITSGTEGRVNVQGATAGGLVGSVNGGSVSYSYSTASVYGTTADAFANGYDTPNTCYAYGWVFYADTTKEDNKNPEINEADINVTEVRKAVYYDDFWKEDVYPFRTIAKLDADLPQTKRPWFMNQHVGDWAFPKNTGYIINE